MRKTPYASPSAQIVKHVPPQASTLTRRGFQGEVRAMVKLAARPKEEQ